MRKFILKSSLHIISEENEDDFVQNISNILNCNFKFREKDEDGDKHWSGKNMGLKFSMCRFNKRDSKSVYALTIVQVAELFEDAPDFNIDFHFIELLKLNGIKQVMNDKEMREYILDQR